MHAGSTLLILSLLLAGLLAHGNYSVTPSYREAAASSQMEIAAESEIAGTPAYSQKNGREEYLPWKDTVPENLPESLIEKIKNNDFSALPGLQDSDLQKLETIKKVYSTPGMNQGLEWAECYLNQNNLQGLVWREKDSDYDQKKMIVAIFALQGNQVTPVYIRSGGEQMTSFYFLSGNGKIIYTYHHYSITQTDIYQHYEFDDELNKKLVCGLQVVNVQDPDDIKDSYTGNPDMPEKGVYYKKHTEQDGILCEETLQEQEFLEAFEDMLGCSFFDTAVKPNWV